MKSVLLTGLIVNHEVPISRSDREVEYKIIGLKGIDLYTLSETELSINESATRVISCKYEFENGEYSIVVSHISGARDIISIYIKSVSGGLLQDIYYSRTVVYNANLDVMFNWHNEPISFSLCKFAYASFHTHLNELRLELSIVHGYTWHDTDFSFARLTTEVINTVRDYILTKISTGLYRYGDKLIAFKDFDGESLIIPDDIGEIAIDDCMAIKNLVLNNGFKHIECNYLGKLSSIAVSRSLSYKQFSDIALDIMFYRGISSNSIAEYYEKSNYKACFDLFKSDKELAESVFGDIDIIVY
jgi:hypothetical protein